MNRAFPLLAALLLALPAQAQTITVPPVVNVDAPGLIVFRATAIDADIVRYFTTPTYRFNADGTVVTYPDGPNKGKPKQYRIQTVPEDIVPMPLGVFMGFALEAGEYKLGVTCAKVVGGKAAMSIPQGISVVVGGAPPIPPIPPQPVDPFAATLQAAYAAETDPAKATQVQTLAALYTLGATSANNPAFKTTGDFQLAWDQNLKASGVNLPKVFAALGAELDGKLPPVGTQALDTATRAAIGTQYSRMAGLLRGLK